MKIGILGYGNLGRGVECAIKQNPDMELAAVFTRRAPETVSILTEGAAVCCYDSLWRKCYGFAGADTKICKDV